MLGRPEACDQRIHNKDDKKTSENEVISFHCGIFDCPNQERWVLYSDGTIRLKDAEHLCLGLRDHDKHTILVPVEDTRRRFVFHQVLAQAQGR